MLFAGGEMERIAFHDVNVEGDLGYGHLEIALVVCELLCWKRFVEEWGE